MRETVRFAVGISFLVLASCAQIPARNTTAANPESRGNASTAGGFVSSSFRFRIVSPPGPVRNGETSITVGASEDLELLAFLSRQDDRNQISSWIPVEPAGRLLWTLRPVFPETGAFVVSLVGKRADDLGNSYLLLAQWSVVADSARADAAAHSPDGTISRSGGDSVRPSGEADPTPAARPLRPDAVKAAFAAAVDGGNMLEVRSGLAACSSKDPATKSAYMSALESILFETPPDRAAAVTACLEAAGMNPNLADGNGWSLLYSAVCADRIDMAKWLLSRGADVNVRGPGQTTVLHALTNEMDNPITPDRYADWARLFLLSGADIDAQNEYGLTAVNMAA